MFYQDELLPLQFPKPMIPDNSPVVLSSVLVNSNVVAKDPSPKSPEFSSGRWKLGLKKSQTSITAPKPSKNRNLSKTHYLQGSNPQPRRCSGCYCFATPSSTAHRLDFWSTV